ncbi:MAG: GNAT family N-acetyltransferase [Betaproteobacteria bacterium]|nr:GNAT family N-acetyltransferase [Betaproteobacteria bacterium]
MHTTPSITIEFHDGHSTAATAIVDNGIGQFNNAAAPLHEVKPLSCFALTEAGAVIGGAVGRRWGACCELQQLWVEPNHRRQGIARRLLTEFEARAVLHGCHSFFLETFSFQAPAFYQSLGYTVAHENSLFPHGIVKYLMVKQTVEGRGQAARVASPSGEIGRFQEP